MTSHGRLGVVLLVLAALVGTCGGGAFVAGGGMAVMGALEGQRTRWTAPGSV